MTLASDIARFVVRLEAETIPDFAIERLKACILNGYGIALGSLDTPYHRVAANAVLEGDGEAARGATLLGDGRRAAVSGASFANAALFHGRCQEDTCGTVHLGAIAVPLLGAMIEAGRGPIDRFLPALLAGYEVAGLFDAPYGSLTAPKGLRASILYGTLGAAAAAARLMDLSEEQTAAALANAAAFSGGTLQSFSDGTDEWRYQVGIAASNGLRAAELARAGSVSAPRAFEGAAGFVSAFVRVECDEEALRGRLGNDWAIRRVTFKPYPVCAFNQTPVEAALAVRGRLGGRAVARATIRMNSYETGYPGMLEYGPFNSISGTLMSVPFCIAATLIHGVPDMARMMTYDDAEIARLMPRIEVVTDPRVANLSTVIELVTEDGEILVQDQRMTAADYAYDLQGVSNLIRRIGAEQGQSPEIHDRLEAFVERLPGGDIGEVAAIFQQARGKAAA